MNLSQKLGQICLLLIITWCTSLESKEKWNLSYQFSAFETQEVGTELITGTDSQTNEVLRDNNPKYLPLYELKTKHLSSHHAFIRANTLSPDLSIFESYHHMRHLFKLQYNLSKRVQLGLHIPFYNDTLTYNASYRSAVNSLSLVTPPEQAKAQGIGDIEFRTKFQVTQHLTAIAGFQGSFLKIGKDATEITKEDNKEELKTGHVADYTRLGLSYHIPFKAVSMSLHLQHEISGKGYEKFLDNDFAIDTGDTTSLSFDIHGTIKDKLVLGTTFSHHHAASDQKQHTDTLQWENIDQSETTQADITLWIKQKPRHFLDLYYSYTHTLYRDVSGGLYETSGRLLAPGLFKIGITMRVDA